MKNLTTFLIKYLLDNVEPKQLLMMYDELLRIDYGTLSPEDQILLLKLLEKIRLEKKE